MATVTKSIGTTGRDYSTITLWEADLDDDTPYDATDDAVGECYNDSAFDETVTINGGNTIGLASITLSVASAERHDGTAGIGARIVRTASATQILDYKPGSTSPDGTIEWLEITETVTDGFNRGINFDGGGTSHEGTIANCIIHNLQSLNSSVFYNAIQCKNTAGTLSPNILNNIIYDIENTDDSYSGTSGAIRCYTSPETLIYNNTIHNSLLSGSAPTGTLYGIQLLVDDVDHVIKNNIVTDTSTTGSGTAEDYEVKSNPTYSNNLSSDTTGSLTEKAATDQFVSTTGGSEDLHLKSGADAIDAGTDLGTTPSGVEIDIDGRDRDAEGDTWDMGAHEFVSEAGASGTGTQTLAALLQAGAGVMQPSGTGVLVLPALTQTGVGALSFVATGAQALPAILQSGLGVTGLAEATAAQTLAAIAQSGAGLEVFVATGVQTLPALTQDGVALEVFTGTSIQTLPAVLQSGAGGTGATFGSSATVLPSILQSGAGSEIFVASAAQSLPAITQAGSGLLLPEGTAAQVLAAVVQSGAGLLEEIGVGAQELAAILQSGDGATGATAGVGAQTLASLLQSGAGELVFVSAGTQTLAAITQAGVASIGLSGVGAQTLPALLQSGAVVMLPVGAGAQTLPAIIQSAAAMGAVFAPGSRICVVPASTRTFGIDQEP